MLTAVTDLIRRPSVGKLTEDLEAINARLASLRDEFGAACLDAEEGGPEADKRKRQHSADIEKAERRAAELQAAIVTARTREAKAEEEAKAADIAQRWTKAADLAHQRTHLAMMLEADAEALIANLGKLVQLSLEMRDVTPGAYSNSYGDVLLPDTVTSAVRTHLAKLGAAWAFPVFPSGKDGIPTLTETIGKANGLALSKRPSTAGGV